MLDQSINDPNILNDAFYKYLQYSQEVLSLLKNKNRISSSDIDDNTNIIQTEDELKEEDNSIKKESLAQANFYYFIIISNERFYLFAAESYKKRHEFISTILNELQQHYTLIEWQKKQAAMQQVLSLFYKQFFDHLKIYDYIYSYVYHNNHDFMEQDLPITSIYKTKSGVLGMKSIGILIHEQKKIQK